MKILIIQTAFLGDVILATSLIEKLRQYYPNSTIDFMLKKGNESLLKNNPHLRKVIVFDKSTKKYNHLWKLIKEVRKEKYTHLINVHRFFTSGLITSFSKAPIKIGFKKNPLSFLYTKAVDHKIDTKSQIHEVDRNQALISELTDSAVAKPKLYPSESDFASVRYDGLYVCIAPASVWYTKQLPIDKWCELIQTFDQNLRIYLLGSQMDMDLCLRIQKESGHKNIVIQAGKISLLQSAALMQKAQMNYVNDSAPLHIASAINAAVTSFFISTTPAFGFGPLSDNSSIIETKHILSCRPCGLHGKNKCPEEHFKCADIEIK